MFRPARSTLGGFPEANLFAKDSGVFCTSDLLYRDGRGDTFDWYARNPHATPAPHCLAPNHRGRPASYDEVTWCPRSQFLRTACGMRVRGVRGCD